MRLLQTANFLSMRRASILRLVFIFCGSCTLWMTGVSPVEAAPARRPHVRGGRVLCDARVTTRRVHGRPRAVKVPPRTVQAVVPIRLVVRRHITGWLQRRSGKPFHDGEAAAIQTGAAVGIPDDPQLRASLVPLGLLTAAKCPIAVSRTVATRAPRGPPASPWFESSACA